MSLLEVIVKEFISIVEILKQNKSVENNRIIIDREQFKQLLEKYKYMTFADKIKAYKDMNLIIHDKNNYTLPCRESTKIVRKVVINYNAYQTIKNLYELKLIN